MASIEDVVAAAHRIGSDAQEAQQRTARCADTLSSHGMQLASVVRGSRTGEEAVRQVQEAQRLTAQCAATLLTLNRTVDEFLRDLTK